MRHTWEHLAIKQDLPDCLLFYSNPNEEGELVDGVVKPVAGGVLQTSSFSLTAESALDIAYRLDREYAAWRCAVNVDAMQHPDKYQH